MRNPAIALVVLIIPILFIILLELPDFFVGQQVQLMYIAAGMVSVVLALGIFLHAIRS